MRTPLISPGISLAAGTRSKGSRPSRQRGIALIIALVFLLMLTILGVSVMNSASLEGRMAGNTQETNRAFQAAESAIEHVFTDGTIFGNLLYPTDTANQTLQYPDATNPTASVQMQVTYAAKKNKMPRARDRQNIDSAVNYGAAVFDMESNATTTSNANSKLVQGVAQVVPKSN
jgi:type IV pilus assembly protein PilX